MSARLPKRELPLALLLIAQAGLVVLLGCAHHETNSSPRGGAQNTAARAAEVIEAVRKRLAPDPHLNVFDISAEERNHELVLTGETSDARIVAELVSILKERSLDASNEVKVLPGAELGGRTWGIVCLSVANGREAPDHKAELGTQGLLGRKVRILKERRHWLLVQTDDHYLSWMERGAIARCSAAEAESWEKSLLLIVTNYESRVLNAATENAEPVSDVVMGNLVKQTGEAAEFWRVALPDGRTGFLPKSAAEDYRQWKESRHATAENVERTARLFLGRPYLWGGNSPKAIDCSGFCKLVFLMNGIELNRNASEQALQGRAVATGSDQSGLRKGDLLFFGGRGSSPSNAGTRPWVTHVAIYLGDRKFIQSSERVQVSSFDPDAPDYDAFHGRSLLFARRVLAE